MTTLPDKHVTRRTRSKEKNKGTDSTGKTIAFVLLIAGIGLAVTVSLPSDEVIAAPLSTPQGVLARSNIKPTTGRTTPKRVGLVPLVKISAFDGYQVGSLQHPPQSTVDVKTFYIAVTETTQGQWSELMSDNPSVNTGNDRPVENLSWFDAATFCNKLSAKEGYSNCYNTSFECDKSKDGYRLPSRAEWSLASFGASQETYPWGNEWSGDYCVEPISKQQFKRTSLISESFTSKVKSRNPNTNGIYDMSGNVSEWCDDIFVQSSHRVFLGGNWSDHDRVSFQNRSRSGMQATEYLPTLGFRVVRRP